jgi:hypothetical protein
MKAKPKSKKPAPGLIEIPYFHDRPAPVDLAPMLMEGDTVVIDNSAKADIGSWAVVEFSELQQVPCTKEQAERWGLSPGIARVKVRAYGRIFAVGSELWAWVNTYPDGTADFRKVESVGLIVRIIDRGGKDRNIAALHGVDAGDDRHRYEVARQLVKRRIAGAPDWVAERRREARRLAAWCARKYLATRRWVQRNYDIINYHRPVDWTIPPPGKRMRARVA